MARVCPLTGAKVVYLDCLECDDKVCRGGQKSPVANNTTLEYDKLKIDLSAYVLWIDGRRVEFPPKEFQLLAHLASSPNQVFSREQLLDAVWGTNYPGDMRTVDVHVKRIREKLNMLSEKWHIATIYGTGYKFETASGG